MAAVAIPMAFMLHASNNVTSTARRLRRIGSMIQLPEKKSYMSQAYIADATKFKEIGISQLNFGVAAMGMC